MRALPDDPYKRRLQIFKRLYQHLDHFSSLRETGRVDFDGVVTLPSGEDVYIPDLTVGLNYLPRRQREAFVLICMRGYTEAAARDELLPASKSSTPVQQYADSGLAKMVDLYDSKQAGFWPPLDYIRPIKDKQGRLVMPTTTTLHPLIKRHLESARKDILLQIEGLRTALSQVEDMMSNLLKSEAVAAKSKPDLNEMAKELAATG